MTAFVEADSWNKQSPLSWKKCKCFAIFNANVMVLSNKDESMTPR